MELIQFMPEIHVYNWLKVVLIVGNKLGELYGYTYCTNSEYQLSRNNLKDQD